MDFKQAFEKLEKSEKLVEELECEAASLAGTTNIEIDSNTLLIQMALALENAVKVINKLQSKLSGSIEPKEETAMATENEAQVLTGDSMALLCL